MSGPLPGTVRGEVESPRPLLAPAGRVHLVGWCLITGQATPPDVRLRCRAGEIRQTERIARPALAHEIPGEPAAPACGYLIAGNLPAGVHEIHLEAALPDGRWQTFKRLSLTVEPLPFTAVLDRPVKAGVLRDRVKAGGWALHPTQAVREITLRYGHREVACRHGLARADVSASFPSAAPAGFETEDFLVAGYGPARIKARLADGRSVLARTAVTFDIATDENHGPELDLKATRAVLPRPAPPPQPAEPSAAGRLRILFLLPGSFAANNALHAAALANELTRRGHEAVIAVARDPGTLVLHQAPLFRGVTFDQARAGDVFAQGRPPDVIHAWTTREIVRQTAEQLLHRHACRLIIHLEDNEQALLALTLGKTWQDLSVLGDAALDRLVPAELSHPHRSRAFLDRADGVTVILDRLREFAPAGKPCLTLWPAADARWFQPLPQPSAFRAALGFTADTTVLFYHGNVHAANAAEMRELYAAVELLNQAGRPTWLIRTGMDAVDFRPAPGAAAHRHVLELGMIPHHHHLPSLMALADYFVQPGGPDAFNDYRFPSKLPEFFAIGRPVIIPRANLGSVVQHGQDAYVLDRADAEGIARAVGELRADPALVDRLGRGARAFAAEHFSWSRSADALAKFYGALAPS